MSIFYQEEPQTSSKRCNCIALALKDAFTKCHSFGQKLTISSIDTEEPDKDFDEEEEVFVSAVISRYMELKSKRKSGFGMDTFYWSLSPTAVESQKGGQKQGNRNEDGEEFFSVRTWLSPCSSAASFNEFISVKTCFTRSSSLNGLDLRGCSRCSSFNRIDFRDFGERSMMMEFSHCQGWPFGLCRKLLLLPPLPKSPSDSWSWRKSDKIIRMHGRYDAPNHIPEYIVIKQE